MSEHSLAIVGATGAVGLKFLQVIDERVKDIKDLRLFASSRSAGQKINFRGTDIVVEDIEKSNLKGVDVAFFSAGTDVSLEYCPKAVKDGALVIDNSNAFRMCDDVPLVVPEANFYTVRGNKGIIANPNCSTIQMVVALFPIHNCNPIKRIVVTTYQSVSGTGLEAIEILKAQSRAILDGKEIPQGVYPKNIAFNLIPEIDVWDRETGLFKEEEKMVRETKKIMGKNIEVCATCVRVPVFYGHSEAVNIELSGYSSLEEITDMLHWAEDIVIKNDPFNAHCYPTPFECQDKDEVFIGRLRNDPTVRCGYNMWIVADNLRRGAATNAVKIYTKMVSHGLI